jgi:hypothetical protein
MLVPKDIDNGIVILAIERLVKHQALQNTAAAKSLHSTTFRTGTTECQYPKLVYDKFHIACNAQ